MRDIATSLQEGIVAKGLLQGALELEPSVPFSEYILAMGGEKTIPFVTNPEWSDVQTSAHLLHNTKENLRAFLELDSTIPFRDYVLHIKEDEGVAAGISLDFTSGTYLDNDTPIELDSVATFDRASEASYYDESGKLSRVSAGVMRQDSRGLLLEPYDKNNLRLATVKTSSTVTVGNTQPRVTGFSRFTIAANSIAPDQVPNYLPISSPSSGIQNFVSITVMAKSSPNVKVALGSGNTLSDYVIVNPDGSVDLPTRDDLSGTLTGTYHEVNKQLSLFANPANNTSRRAFNVLFGSGSLTGGNGAGLPRPAIGEWVELGFLHYSTGTNPDNYPMTPLMSVNAATERLPDILTINLPEGVTKVNGDWDSDVKVTVAGGVATVQGFGYVRSINY